MLGRLLTTFSLIATLSLPVLARPQDAPTDVAPAAPPAAAPTAPAPRKVWTNEDLAGTKGGISVVGDKRNKNYHMGSNAPADPATIARIKKSLDKLQIQLDDGEPVSTGERDTSKGYSRTPVDQQMNQLLNKKKDLESQIGDLLDEARKKGIDPGQLR
jgi:hypothetical protein